jgi:hypothetical protein
MLNVSTNPERKQFVLQSSHGVSCFGFDNAYNESLQLTRMMHRSNALQERVDETTGLVALQLDGIPVGPNPVLYGTLDGYEEYRRTVKAVLSPSSVSLSGPSISPLRGTMKRFSAASWYQ